MNRKFVVDTYTFTAASRTIDMPSVPSLQLDGIQLITNVTTNTIIYQFSEPSLGGSLSGTTLTLDFDTTSMSDSDSLMIIYDSPTDTPAESVTVSGTVTVDGSGATQPVSIASNVNSNTFDAGGNGITSHSGGGQRGLDVSIIDGSGNQVVSFGGGTQYVDGASSGTSPTGTMAMWKTSSDLASISSEAAPFPIQLMWLDSVGLTRITTSSQSPLPCTTSLDVGGTMTKATGLSLNTGTVIAQQVALVDASGNQVVSFGGGTEYTEGDTVSSPVGKAILIQDSSNNLHVPTAILDAGTPFMGVWGAGGTIGVHGEASIPVSSATAALPVAIIDGSGNQVSSFSGGEQHAAGDSLSGAKGNVLVFDDGTSTAAIPSPSNGLPVNIVGGSSSGTEYTWGDGFSNTATGPSLLLPYPEGTAFYAPSVTNDDNDRIVLLTMPVDRNNRLQHHQYKMSDSSIGTGEEPQFTAIGFMDGDVGQNKFPQHTSYTRGLPVRFQDNCYFAGGTSFGSDANGGTLMFHDQNDVWQGVTGLDLTTQVRPLHVALVDGSGAQITSFGGGSTAHTDAESDAGGPNGNAQALAWTDGSNWHITSSTNPFPVSGAITGSVTVSSGSVTVSGTVAATQSGSWTTAATQSGSWTVAATQSGSWTAAATQSGTWNVRNQDGSGNAIDSATSHPAGTERGLIVRNIPQTRSGSATVTSTSNTITITDVGGMSTMLIYITGTWVATFVPQMSMDNGTTFVNINASPGWLSIFDVQNGAWVGQITNNGLYQVNVCGSNAVKLNVAAYTSGTATVKVSVSAGGPIDHGRMNNNSVVISASSSGNNTVIASVTSKKIRVTSWNFMANGAVNAKFTDGAGGSDLTGLYYLIANTGLSVPFNPEGYFTGSISTALVINLSAAVAIGGVLTYAKVDA